MNTEYKVIKETSLLTIAQAGPKGCQEFTDEYLRLAAHMSAANYAAFVLLPDYNSLSIQLPPVFNAFISWMERSTKRVDWFIKHGFLEVVKPELKPCPFKHVDNSHSLFFESTRHGIFVHCSICGARGSRAKTENEAVELWNDRA